MPGFKVNMKLKAICVRLRQHNSRPSDWHHCSTDFNIAEDVTKGISPEELNGRWFKEDLSPKKLGSIDVKEVERRGERFVPNMRMKTLCPVRLNVKSTFPQTLSRHHLVTPL